MTGVPGVDRPTTAAQDWDATAEAKGRPTVAELAAPEDGIDRAKAWADERRAARTERQEET